MRTHQQCHHNHILLTRNLAVGTNEDDGSLGLLLFLFCSRRKEATENMVALGGGNIVDIDNNMLYVYL